MECIQVKENISPVNIFESNLIFILLL